jgi:hypothetical protein
MRKRTSVLFKIRNSNIEFRNNVECTKEQFSKRFGPFEYSDFEFVSNLDIRASILLEHK